MPPVKITYFSDVLCIWATIAQRRIEQLVEKFGDQIAIDVRYCSVFPDAWGKIETTWGERGGFAGFNRHLNEVAEKFPHIEISPQLWLETRPRTSASAHLFLKAVELIERDEQGDAKPWLERLSVRAAWATRQAFFLSAEDISDFEVQEKIAAGLGIDATVLNARIRSPEAFALLAADYDMGQKQGVVGSPTFIMNNGRQKLFGNVGYRLLEANVQELLRRASDDEASWC